MFSSSPALTLDRYQLVLSLSRNSANSEPSALKSTFHGTTHLPSSGQSLLVYPACPEKRRKDCRMAPIPFRITSFAHPHPLTPIESYSCKKQGRGWGVRNLHPTQALPSFSTVSKHTTRSNANISTLFTRLLHSPLDTRGWGMPPSLFTTQCPLPTVPFSPLTGLPENFYPPAPDLRHNPAAQGHTIVRLNDRAHSSLQTGRIQ
jgi:hypothetical protein